MSGKVTIEFNGTPPLIFVQHKVGDDFEVFQDGKKVNGVRSVVIRAGYDEVTTHEIEYLTGKTKGESD